MRLALLAITTLLTTACATSQPKPADPFAAIPKASPAAIVTARGALAWHGRGDLPPGSRVVHTGEDFTPPKARVALIDVAPTRALCAIDERDPRVILAVGADLHEDEEIEDHAIRVVAGAATHSSARLRVARLPGEASALGAIAIEDAPDTTVRGGEVPLLVCD